METTQLGWYDNAQKPVLTIKPGDSVVMETMMHFHDRLVPGATLDMLLKIRQELQGRGAHTLTGPIYIEGAEPGDVLEVRIVDVRLRGSQNPDFAGRAFGSNAAAWWGFHYNDPRQIYAEFRYRFHY